MLAICSCCRSRQPVWGQACAVTLPQNVLLCSWYQTWQSQKVLWRQVNTRPHGNLCLVKYCFLSASNDWIHRTAGNSFFFFLLEKYGRFPRMRSWYQLRKIYRVWIESQRWINRKTESRFHSFAYFRKKISFIRRGPAFVDRQTCNTHECSSTQTRQKWCRPARLELVETFASAWESWFPSTRKRLVVTPVIRR